MPSPRVSTLEARTALTRGQMDFLDRIHVCARLLATPHLRKAEVIEGMLDAFPGMTEKEARRWIGRAREYIKMGAPEDQLSLRSDYIAKLDWFISLCSRHLVKDKTEITFIHDATATPQEGEGEAAPGAPKMQVEAGKIKSFKKKVSPESFNAAVAQILLKALREKGEVTGARPRPGAKSVVITQNNLNMPGGRKTAELSNDDLVRRCFGENIQLLPEPGAEGHPAPGPAETPPVVPAGDGHGA